MTSSDDDEASKSDQDSEQQDMGNPIHKSIMQNFLLFIH